MDDLLQLLRQALKNDQADFRDGQLEAIQSVLEPPYRSLVVQATGWGKSMVYFIATKVLRGMGRGPTMVVSPLLSLMRNQVESANNLGLRAESYTSENADHWADVEAAIKANEIDLLLISPERLANERFQLFVASSTLAKVGLIVIDEAHCISDWGHDFRPDYQRLGELARRLPSTTAILATTATANNRVVEDVVSQIGAQLQVIRGSLARKSLQIQVMSKTNAAERLAWLDSQMNSLPGSGIIYTLTVRDAYRVAKWLQQRGHNVHEYHGQLEPEERVKREKLLLTNGVKALVATIALGMGFDKPDLGFVVHYQSPGNLVAYYQQIGRAGRAVEDALAILFLGSEDEDILNFFIEHARPSAEEVESVLSELEQSESGLSIPKLTERLNLTKTEIETIMKSVSATTPSPVAKVGTSYIRTPVPFVHDVERDERLKSARREERRRFESFAATDDCYMQLVREELDDPTAEPCGRCSNCLGHPVIAEEYTNNSLEAALRFLNRSEHVIKPRKQWPSGSALPEYGLTGRIASERRCEDGLCLSLFGDPGIASWAQEDKGTGRFRDDLLQAAIEALERTDIDSKIDWVCAVPSLRSERIVPDFAERLAQALGVPYIDAVVKVKETPPQKDQRNSFRQAQNLDGAFSVQNANQGTVLLVDDVVNSRWTFAIIGALLRAEGAEAVIPFALSSAQSSGADD